MQSSIKLLVGLLLASQCFFVFAQSAQHLAEAILDSQRPAQDKERDENRKAPEILEFMGVKQGDSVLDVIAMGGWYSEVLSYAVGGSGTVYMHNNPIAITERSTDERAERTSRLKNVNDFVGSIGQIPAGSIDFAITALNFHDVYNRSEDDSHQLLRQIYSALKPGGVLGIIDHKGTPGADNVTLHRITFEDAVTSAVEAGFVLTGTSSILKNSDDDHTLGPFDPSLGRNTDRLVLRLAKPQ